MHCVTWQLSVGEPQTRVTIIKQPPSIICGRWDMLHFSDGQKLARGISIKCSHIPWSQAWPAYPCSEDPAPRFYASFWKLPAACAISRQSDGGVSATLGSELGSSGFLGLLLDGLCLETGTPSLGSHHPCEKIFSSQMSSFISCLFFK